MGIAPRVPSAESVMRAAEQFFEPQLASLNLTVEDIESQDLQQLKASLERVNDAIQNASSFGSAKVQMAIRGGTLFAVVGDATSGLEIGIGSILLARKSLILQRITAVQPQKQLSDIREAIAAMVSDTDLREQLLAKVDESGERAQVAAEQIQAEAEQTEVERIKLMMTQIEVQERKSKIWLAFLQRESVASIVGALLLLVLGLGLLVAMFTHTKTLEVVTSAFLLILGYFFGQSSAKGAPDSAGAPPARPGS